MCGVYRLRIFIIGVVFSPQVSDVLPDHIEIKVRQRPDKDAVVCGALEKGMVVTCEAQKGNWLQIRFNDFDSVWVYETSGEITLMDKLHRFLQVKMPNITNHKSPCRVEPHLLELTPVELREELLQKRQEKKEAEEAALAEAEAKKAEEEKGKQKSNKPKLAAGRSGRKKHK
jgi:hypothetical protein